MLNDIQILRSPCCFARLTVCSAINSSKDYLVNGEFICTKCGQKYPVVRGNFYLTVINSSWDVVLQELVSRRNITQRIISRSDPAPANPELELQNKTSALVMDTLFSEALKNMPQEKGLSIIDVGAGECKVTKMFAGMGYKTYAADSEPSTLQYQNYKCLDLQLPESITISGSKYYQYMTDAHDFYFQTIVAPAEHLPIASDSFDIVFCRATLHHLSKLEDSIREMVRICKPGGKIVFSAEPMRSVLDPEKYYIDGVVDSEEGLNERSPHLLDYLLPLLKAKARIKIQYWRKDTAPRTKKFIKLLPFNWDKHFLDGEIAGGRKLLKLLLTSASINIYAEKSKRSGDRIPGYWDTVKFAEPEDLALIYGKRSIQESLDNFSEDTKKLMSIRRKILAGKGYLLNDFAPYKIENFHLWQGWGRRYIIDEMQCRVAYSLSLCTLSRSENSRTLNIVYYSPETAGKRKMEIRVNDEISLVFPVENEKWNTIYIPLTEIKEKIIDISLSVTPSINNVEEITSISFDKKMLTTFNDIGLFIQRIYLS